MTALGDLLAEVQPGFACGKQDPDGVFQFRMNNVSKTSDIVLDQRRRVPRDAHKKMSKFEVGPGDVLFNATNSPDGVGKAVLVPVLDESAVFSNHFLRLRPVVHQLDGNYLWRWLQLQFQRGVFQSMCRQWVNQATVSKESLLALDISVPPLDEQRRIAAILDHADALRAKRRQVLAHLDALTQAIFNEMFGDIRTNEHGYGVATIDDVAERVTDGEHKTPRRSESGFPLLSARNVRDGWIDFENTDFVDEGEYELLSRRIEPRQGDVLISCSGTIGRVAQVRERTRFAMVRSAALVRPGTAMNPTFLERTLSAPTLKAIMVAQANSSAQANLFQNQIKRLPVIVPPLTRQNEFAERVTRVDSVVAVARKAQTNDDVFFLSLQSRAFRGEL